ncbi:TonB-dependent receptor [Halopseudomonas nanhaiensis]|uniref:TonB-dependent receptor n=1 Tax=Halopseudomonas nanhaiensis TaxID=2830842 RepID=UPI001CBCF17C|nr:TonB-dependent receptor [Halopseudomonas nanhaiensis]UAW97198.1 TonB-dependent receptor [Halopseudomonas nanhaiensis]
MKLKPTPLALGIGLAVFSTGALAETVELDPVIVSANALARPSQDMVVPAQVLNGTELVMTREATLGETLDHLPGLRSSSFGAGAGRPVIRGLDGARVKVLSDGVDVLDASTVSPDHAVTSEPLLAERIEVLKGPAALLYGGGAIGGVINVIDRKVPTYIPENGYEADLELRGNSVANEHAGAFGITAGAGNFTVRAEGSKRKTDDYEIPGSVDEQTGSYNDTDSFTLGGSFIGDRGFIGLAYGEQNRRYGLPFHEHADCHTHGPRDWHCSDHDEHGHEEEHDEHAGHEDEHEHEHDHEHEAVPYVDMKRKRWDLRAQASEPLPGFESVRVRVGHSQYEHDEIENGVVGTRFSNDATDARVELTHRSLLGWRGVIGAQTLRRDFETTGEEAYVPHTLTRNHGLFLLEEFDTGTWRYEVGLRQEWQHIDADGADNARHQGTSASAGAVWTFRPNYSLGLGLSRSQRLPTAEELYANGPHAATSTVELGNPDLDEETSYNAELTLSKLAGPATFTVSLFRNAIDDFIYAADTGSDVGGELREIEYRQRDAIFTGVEGEVRFEATASTAVTFFGDHVRGELRSGGEDLPRIPADRLGVRLNQRFTPAINGSLQFHRIRQQDRLASFESETEGYNMLSAGLSYSGDVSDASYLLYLKANNLLNEKAREHTSFIKDEVLLPGRNLTAGVRFSF